MAEQPSVFRARGASPLQLPQVDGVVLHWVDSIGTCDDVEPHPFSACVRQPSFQAKGSPMTKHRARPYWTTGQVARVPAVPPQAIAWEKEAALMTVSLAPVLLAATAQPVLPEATGW
jgi:hypothetical protein